MKSGKIGEWISQRRRISCNDYINGAASMDHPCECQVGGIFETDNIIMSIICRSVFIHCTTVLRLIVKPTSLSVSSCMLTDVKVSEVVGVTI